MKSIPSCDLYDYLEIACLFRYQLKLQLEQGREISGIATNVGTNPQKEEILYIAEQGLPDKITEINTNSILSMTVLTPNARFQQVTFRQA
ncbi:MAG: Rho-binding antiterminator [Aliiglaciecola sp.]|uniref:Rho-binding antiterminator n=1 Tax=Aliiglaciecola sp. M165 TaxID=2593649 RepID=UPI0011804FCC|nr:Rho-binding antiterminator [Aliiglaciecola sp. M165]TRY29343.1 hypothetical protein FM019_18245 [Aliiglaciecola sp. M165]